MTRFLRLGLCALLLGSTTTLAEDDVDVGDTIGGQRPPELDGRLDIGSGNAFEQELASYEGRPYDPYCYYGARVLDLPPEFVHDGREAIDYLFHRDYPNAKKAFSTIATKYRGYGLGPVGQILVWQSLMIENFDFRFESQYKLAYKRARQELEESAMTPGNEAWEYFLLAGVLGIDSIHSMRREEVLTAVNRGYEAIKYAKKVKDHAPDFTDMQLGDGLFNYWLAVISRSTKLIPTSDDTRQLGIQQMETVEARGVYLGPPATLALTFTWIEEGKYRDALKSSLKNRRDYPKNVINNLVFGRIHMYLRNYDESEKAFKEVMDYAPENMRVHYYIGRLYNRWGKRDKAMSSFDKYLTYDGVSEYDQAVAWYYKGNIKYREKDYDTAEQYYKKAWKLAKLEKAKRKLDRIKEKRSKG